MEFAKRFDKSADKKENLSYNIDAGNSRGGVIVMKKEKWSKKAVYLIIVLSLLLPLGAVMGPLATAGAEEVAQYSATQIESWLIDQIEGSSITHSTPSVTLNSTNNTMTVNAEATVGKAAGSNISMALNSITFTFDGSLVVKAKGELAAFGMTPRFGQDGNDIELTVACTPGGSPQVTAVSNVNIGGFWPSLSSSDLDKIADLLTQIIAASGLTVDSLAGNLTGIAVMDDGGTPKLQFTADSGTPVVWDEQSIVDKLDAALDSLAAQGEDYLSTGRPAKWDLGVSVTTDTKLTLDLEATLFGLTASADGVDITLGDMAATAEGSISLGSSKSTTFSATGDLSCSNYVPAIAVTDLGIGDDYPGVRDWIESSKSALINGLDQLATNVIADTGLQVGLPIFTHIGIVGDNLEIRGGGIPIEGIVTEVDCTAMEGATLTLYEGEVEKNSTTSDAEGNYILYAPAEGSYTVVASKDGFRPRTQIVEVTTGTNELNFRANMGLVPINPDRLYVMACVWYWLHPGQGCDLDRLTIMEVVYWWLHPTEM